MKKQKGNIAQLIGGAAKLAGLTLNVAPLTSQEREDVSASAALGYVKGSQKGQPERYEFRAAKNEAMKFIIDQVFKHGQTSQLREGDALDDLGAEIESEFQVDESHLADLFLKQRTKKGGRGWDASKRDAKICALILAGYGNVGIAHELSISRGSVRRYRTDIRKRLEKMQKDNT